MFKKLLFLSFSVATTIICAEDTIEVTESCAKNLEMINQDGAKLYYVLKGAFQERAKDNDPGYKPSDLIKQLTSQESKLDELVPLEYTDATQYLEELVVPYLNQLDAKFDEQYDQTKNVEQAWKQFTKYFKKEGFKQPLDHCKQQLIYNDQERIKWAKKGVFFSDDGKTVLVSPY